MISKRFRRIFMWLLITFGIGILILVQVVDHNGLTDLQDPITRTVWVYLIFLFIFFFLMRFQWSGIISRKSDLPS